MEAAERSNPGVVRDPDNIPERTPERCTRPDASDPSARALLFVARYSDLGFWTIGGHTAALRRGSYEAISSG